MTIMLNGIDLTVMQGRRCLNPAVRAGQIDGYHAPMQDAAHRHAPVFTPA